MKAKAIIGANFGDEGKGLMTDYFVSKADPNSIVVRFNGGAQAGHTVVTPDGKKYRFAHFGCGHFLGKPTYLAKHFIVNPLVLKKEFDQFVSQFGFEPKIFIDENCRVTLPFDMAINQELEQRRTNKHGSCGIGIWETVRRSALPDSCLKIGEFSHPTKVMRTWVNVSRYYIQRGMEIAQEDPELIPHISDIMHSVSSKADSVAEAFGQAIAWVLSKAKIVDLSLLDDYEDIIFEGAQGLLLDQDNKDFAPHITASSTGLRNVVVYCRQLGIREIEATYVTRTYMTRHGAGPFPTECEANAPPYKGASRSSNPDNQFQGSMRFGHLDLVGMACAIARDIKNNTSDKMEINRGLAVTCMDQLDNGCISAIIGKLESMPINDFMQEATELIGTSRKYISQGRTRNDVKEI